MTPRERADINMSGIPVAGDGGLGMLAVAVVMATYYPQAWWLIAFGSIGGAAFAGGLVWYRRHDRASGPSGDDPSILFRPEPGDIQPRHRVARRPPRDLEELAAAG